MTAPPTARFADSLPERRVVWDDGAVGAGGAAVLGGGRGIPLLRARRGPQAAAAGESFTTTPNAADIRLG
jgi:hypothetical protein